MAQYGVVLSGVTVGVLAYQKGVFDSFLRSSDNSQSGQSTISAEDKSNNAGQREEAAKSAPQYDGLHYYETVVTCPRF